MESQRYSMESIKKNSRFRYIYSNGRSYVSDLLVLYYIPNDSDTIRFGITISKKVGKAVLRNKIKRRIKAILRLNEASIAVGYDIIFVVRVRANTSDYASVSSNVRFLLTRTALIPKNTEWVY